MDFSIAIKLEKDKQEQAQKEEEKGGAAAMYAHKRFQLDEYHRNAGQAHYELSQYEEAQMHFQLAIKEDSANSNAHLNYFNRGLCQSKLKKYEEAKDSYTLALKHFDAHKQDGEKYRVQYNMGINYRNMDMIAESIDMLSKAVSNWNTSINTEISAAYNYLGLSYFEQRQFREAQKSFKKAIDNSQPKMAVHFNNRGLANYHMGIYESALEDFNIAISIEIE